MAAPPCPCASAFGAAAIAVAATPVANMSRRVESIIDFNLPYHHSSFRDARARNPYSQPVVMDSGFAAARRPGMTMEKLSLRRFSDLVLRPRVEITGVMALVQLAGGIAGDSVDHAPALHGRTLGKLVG